MTETSGPFKAAASGDQWQETDWGNMMKRLFRDGVFSGYLNELEVVKHTPSADMYADVKTGGGWVQGHIHANSALKAMTIDAAHATLDRTDRIVLRRTYASPNSEIALAVLKGVDMAAGTSTPTALTQDATTWEISLATVLVAAAVTAIYTADITDERRSAYCGIAAATLGDFAIDTSGNLDGNGMKIVDLADPTTDQDAATKKYVDDLLGGLVDLTVITSGSGNFTTSANTTKIKVTLYGGGGAGGGAAGGTAASGAGAGGGAGAKAIKVFTVTPSTDYAYEVGAGGTPGAAGNNPGGDGGTTAFIVGATTVTAVGGKGGAGMAAQTTAKFEQALGGLGGTSTNGDVNGSGQNGQNVLFYCYGSNYPEHRLIAFGLGGCTDIGRSGLPTGLFSAPGDSSGYGAGGSGGACTHDTPATDVAGKAGMPGLIIIEEYT